MISCGVMPRYRAFGTQKYWLMCAAFPDPTLRESEITFAKPRDLQNLHN